MESICPICKNPYDGVSCIRCTVTNLNFGALGPTEALNLESQEKQKESSTAFLVDLVSNRKISITTPYCKVGRDDLNDIVISGDPSISRFHLIITTDNNRFLLQDSESKHGTFLNGNRITAPASIHDGDVIKIGVSLFWFVVDSQTTQDTKVSFYPVETTGVEADAAATSLEKLFETINQASQVKESEAD